MDQSSANVEKSTAPTPWLSVVIPIFNAEKHLKYCLETIQKQTCTEFEVLLIDDGSTDLSHDICIEYVNKDSRFRYIKKENGGAYQTRIFGAEHALGTYVTFCDADDYYTTKDAFAILRRYLSSGQYDAVQFGFAKKFNHLKQKKSCVKTAVSIDRERFLTNEYPRLLCSYWDNAIITVNVWNKVYHRRLLHNFPASASAEKIFWGDDLIINLHLLSTCNSFLFIPDILYGYRQFSGGTNKFSKRTMEDLNSIKKYQLHYLDEYKGADTAKIQSTLFSETACWFYCHVQQSLKHLSEPEIETMIAESIILPSFVKARDYYLHESDCNWEAMELLRKADPKEYIARGKVFPGNRPAKEAIRSFLMKIYASI